MLSQRRTWLLDHSGRFVLVQGTHGSGDDGSPRRSRLASKRGRGNIASFLQSAADLICSSLTLGYPDLHQSFTNVPLSPTGAPGHSRRDGFGAHSRDSSTTSAVGPSTGSAASPSKSQKRPRQRDSDRSRQRGAQHNPRLPAHHHYADQVYLDHLLGAYLLFRVSRAGRFRRQKLDKLQCNGGSRISARMGDCFSILPSLVEVEMFAESCGTLRLQVFHGSLLHLEDTAGSSNDVKALVANYWDTWCRGRLLDPLQEAGPAGGRVPVLIHESSPDDSVPSTPLMAPIPLRPLGEQPSRSFLCETRLGTPTHSRISMALLRDSKYFGTLTHWYLFNPPSTRNAPTILLLGTTSPSNDSHCFPRYTLRAFTTRRSSNRASSGIHRILNTAGKSA